jgi:outer membrane protein OmpA-like peptidoglycan-associated protein
VVAAVVVAAVMIALLPGHPATAQEGNVENRVRDLEFRWVSLDDSQRVRQSGRQTTVILSADVLFEFDSDALVPEAAARLDELAGDVRELGGRTVTISGHTDSKGEPAYNQDLSVRRAESVRDALTPRLGGAFSFEVGGFAETEPVAPNEHEDGSDNPEGRALNRRVEIRYPTG